MKKFRKYVLPITTAAIAIGVTGCNDDEDQESSVDKLIGQWEITDADGDISDLADNDYTVNFEFQLDGDVEICFITEDEKYSYHGDWEWSNSKHTEIEMKFSNDDLSVTLSIDTFEGDEITGEMTFEYDGEDSLSGDVTLERIDDDKKSTKSTKIGNIENNPDSIKWLKHLRGKTVQ